jgi:hypothetical protein
MVPLLQPRVDSCALLFPPSLYYGEQLAPIRRARDRRNGLRSQRRVDKLPNGPSPVNHAQRLRWRRLEGFMHSAEVVMGNVQRDRRNVVVQLL